MAGTDQQEQPGAAGLADRAAAAAARTAVAMDPRPSRVRPYQRRRRGPVAVVVGLLAALTIGTWTTVLTTTTNGIGEGSCPLPAGGQRPGEVVERDALYAVPPAPLSAVRVLVRNAGGQRGQANLVAAELGDLGIPEAGPPDNDTFYPNGDMECVGQLRFGPTGEAAASTLALALPCVELIRDGRADDTLEIAVGTTFGDLSPGRPARDALDQLGGSTSGGSDGSANADPSAQDAPAPVSPTVDPGLLERAREDIC